MKPTALLKTIAVFLLTLQASYGQSLPYTHKSQPLFNLGRQHFFKQTIVDKEVSQNDYKIKRMTYYLNEDKNNDGIPDLRKILHNTTAHPSGNISRLISEYSEVEIYRECPNTMFFLDSQNEKHLPEYINGFYRYSKILALPSKKSIKHMQSLPILFQKPQNSNKKECKIQILYKTKFKQFESLNLSSKNNNYQTYIEVGNDSFDSYYIDFNTDGSHKLVKTKEAIDTYSVNWGRESWDEVVYEIILKW